MLDEESAKEFEQGFAEDPSLTTDAPPPTSDADDDAPTETTPPDEVVDNESETPVPTETPEETTPPEETPPLPTEASQTLTKEDIRSVINDLRNEERYSTKELDMATQEVLQAYYPSGLPKNLVDEKTGQEIKTPQDVVELSGGEMSIEEATQWLMNKQYEYNRQISEIEDNARQVAETTVNFRRDGIAVLEKYGKLFEKYPQVQEKVWDQYKKLVKADEEKGVVLSAPDMMEFYDTMLEPYRLAFEHSQQQAATQPVTTPEPPKPSVKDRLDEHGDGGASDDIDDPNDFASQVLKELKRKD